MGRGAFGAQNHDSRKARSVSNSYIQHSIQSSQLYHKKKEVSIKSNNRIFLQYKLFHLKSSQEFQKRKEVSIQKLFHLKTSQEFQIIITRYPTHFPTAESNQNYGQKNFFQGSLRSPSYPRLYITKQYFYSIPYKNILYFKYRL